MFGRIMWLAFAGACGTVSRFAVYELVAKTKATHLPLGTFTVNVFGSFLFGLLYAVAQSRLNVSDDTRLILLTGFVGAFTTFSTFAFEIARMMKSDQWALAVGNALAQLVFGILALGIGVLAGRQLAR